MYETMNIRKDQFSEKATYKQMFCISQLNLHYINKFSFRNTEVATLK